MNFEEGSDKLPLTAAYSNVHTKKERISWLLIRSLSLYKSLFNSSTICLAVRSSSLPLIHLRI